MNRIIRPLARTTALLLAAGFGAQAFACSDVTFSFDNNTGGPILVNRVQVYDATAVIYKTVAVSKTCENGYNCVTTPVNLAPIVVGDNISSARFRYQIVPGVNLWSPWKGTANPTCANHRNYGALYGTGWAIP